jgi:AcrR family transcriptional regulator
VTGSQGGGAALASTVQPLAWSLLTSLHFHVSNYDMKAQSATSIRQAYKDMTRYRVLDAAIALMAEDREAALTVAAVAARAGVTERTIYRHFRTRDALVEAVWPRMQARVRSQGFPRTARALVATPLRLFPNFDRDEALVRASVHSESGREVRLRANGERQAAMLACVDDALPGLDEGARRRRAAVVQLIDSAYGWAVLKDFWDLDGEQAGQAASEAIAVLLGLRAPEDSDAIAPQQEENEE